MMKYPFIMALTPLISSIIVHSGLNKIYGQHIIEKENYTVNQTSDFQISGDGKNASWVAAPWLNIIARDSADSSLTTQVKALYSKTGIYFLFNCLDEKITTSMDRDFMDLWKQDVAELFLWPDESSATYFEYEISPLNYELPLLISNDNADLVRWMPFHYNSDRKVQHKTVILGGKRENHANIEGWTAEIYIPYKLLRPLTNILPKKGTKWRANFYRVDYDHGQEASWSWQKTGDSFHDYQKFGTLLFN